MRIRTTTRFLLLAATLAGTTGAVALAQNASVYDPAQLPAFKGKVVQYSLTPRGDVDGLILADGTEVHLPPHFSTQLVFAARPGDAVTIHGLKARALPMIQAMSVTNDATGTTVVDTGPAEHGPEHGPGGEHGPMMQMERLFGLGGPRGGGPGPHGPGGHGMGGHDMGGPGGTAMEDTSTVKMQLHGPRGDLNGALLADGTIVRLPPPAAEHAADQLTAGHALYVRGFGFASPLGKVIDARALGTDASHAADIVGPHHGGPDAPPPPPVTPGDAPSQP